ncbi:CPBP family intramembrane metalloprotease, partial [bacterium]|nr:CPBP family intramembrane metalloprotease [bacterium]
WLVSYLISIPVLAVSTISYSGRRFSQPTRSLGFSTAGVQWFPQTVFFSIVLAGFFYFYLAFVDSNESIIFFKNAEFWKTSSETLGPVFFIFSLVLVYGIIAPLVEEMFFRGFVDQALRRIGMNGFWGIIVNGALFSLFYPWIAIPPVMLMGFFLTLLFRRSETLWPCILSHSIFNFFIVFLCAWNLR